MFFSWNIKRQWIRLFSALVFFEICFRISPYYLILSLVSLYSTLLSTKICICLPVFIELDVQPICNNHLLRCSVVQPVDIHTYRRIRTQTMDVIVGLLLTALFVCSYLYFTRYSNYRVRSLINEFPGPKIYPFIGTALPVWWMTREGKFVYLHMHIYIYSY